MRHAEPVEKDLVLIGGGHSHVAVLRNFGMSPMPGVRLTLIARDVYTPYSGMLPGLIAGHYGFDDAHIDLAPLAVFADARLYHDTAIGLDLERRLVMCRDRPPVPFDVLSLDIGVSPDTAGVPGADVHAVPVKPIDRFAARWAEVEARVLASRGPFAIGVVGAGAGGVEVLLAAQWRLSALIGEAPGRGGRLSFHLLSRTPDILPDHNPMVRRRFRRVLKERGVIVHLGRSVIEVAAGQVRCDDGAMVPLDEVLWTTSAAAAGWLRETGLDLNEDGFIRVDAGLRSLSHAEVFAAGDVAAVEGHPRPKAGVFAVRQGPPLAANLRRALLSQPPRPFRPQRRFLSLISTGDRYAVASRNGLAIEGRWVWRWKDAIDRAFMRRFSELPEMGGAGAGPGTAVSAEAMRCGGCGAKIGPAVLHRVLARLGASERPEVMVGLAQPDDAAVLTVPAGKTLVQSTDFFRAFIDDPYVLGQVAASHALGDLHAMGASPWTALASVALPYGAEAKVEDDLFQILSGVVHILTRDGALLVGGHSAEGAETTVGLTVNGLGEPDLLLRKGGLLAGDALILTKPIGTGVLFAGHMRGKTRGRWIDAALRSMLASQSAAVAVMRAHGAHACTDVSGFGLVGHLLEMLRASSLSAEINLGAVPLLDGALDLARDGIESTLLAANLIQGRDVIATKSVSSDAGYRLLFDPQTSGGLLVGIPHDRAPAFVESLRQAGYERTAVVGRVLPAEAGVRVILGGETR